MEEFIAELRQALDMFGIKLATHIYCSSIAELRDGETDICQIRVLQNNRISMLGSTFSRGQGGRYRIERARVLYMKARTEALEYKKKREEQKRNIDWARSLSTDEVTVYYGRSSNDKPGNYSVSLNCGDDQTRVLMLLDYLRDIRFLAQ